MQYAYDTIIIGGGIIGHACAVSLVERGMRVLLMDAQPWIAAASEATTGVLIPPMGHGAAALHRCTEQSAAMYPAWCAHLAKTTGISPEYAPSGALRLLSHTDRRCGQSAPPYVNPVQVREVVPIPAAHVQTNLLLQALAIRFAQLGGSTLQTKVATLEGSHGRITRIILANGIALRPGHVLVSAGYGTSALLAPLGITLPLVAERGHIVQFHGVPHPPDTILLDGDHALVVKQDRRLHVTGPDIPIAIEARVRALFGGGTIAHVWHGIRPRVRGGIPLIGRIAEWRNLFVAVGHGKNGFLLAPFTAQRIASELTH